LNSDRIKTYIADQANRSQLKSFIDANGCDFDIILDDGGHSMEQQQVSFGYLFKCVKPGGYYIIEDVHTSLGISGEEEKWTTLSMIYNFVKTGKIESKYMTKEEMDYLSKNIRYCNLLVNRIIEDSITCICKKKYNMSEKELVNTLPRINDSIPQVDKKAKPMEPALEKK
jgi:hypothetical protein